MCVETHTHTCSAGSKKMRVVWYSFWAGSSCCWDYNEYNLKQNWMVKRKKPTSFPPQHPETETHTHNRTASERERISMQQAISQAIRYLRAASRNWQRAYTKPHHWNGIACSERLRQQQHNIFQNSCLSNELRIHTTIVSTRRFGVVVSFLFCRVSFVIRESNSKVVNFFMIKKTKFLRCLSATSRRYFLFRFLFWAKTT